MSATVSNRMALRMSDLERYLTSKLNGQYGLRYQQLLDELRGIQKTREASDNGSDGSPAPAFTGWRGYMAAPS